MLNRDTEMFFPSGDNVFVFHIYRYMPGKCLANAVSY